MRVYAHHADDECEHVEEPRAACGDVGEVFRFFVGKNVRVTAKVARFGGVERWENREAAECVVTRATGRAGFLAPEFLTVGHDELDEGVRFLRMRRTTKQADGVHAETRAALGVCVADARAAVGAADGFALEATVEINRHPRDRLASFHIERDF